MYNEFSRYFTLNSFHKLSMEEFQVIYTKVGLDSSQGLNRWEYLPRNGSYLLRVNDFIDIRIWDSGSIEFRRDSSQIYRRDGFASFNYRSSMDRIVSRFHYFESGKELHYLDFAECDLRLQRNLRENKLERILNGI